MRDATSRVPIQWFQDTEPHETPRQRFHIDVAAGGVIVDDTRAPYTTVIADPAHPQQMHLDIRVTDPDRAKEQLLALGATRARCDRETGVRVFVDPVGHPFCIVFGRADEVL